LSLLPSALPSPTSPSSSRHHHRIVINVVVVVIVVTGIFVIAVIVVIVASLSSSLQVRRVKSEVEKSLLPKQEFILKVPLTKLQLQWYKQVLHRDEGTKQVLSGNQMKALLTQLRKVVNHPKALLFQHERNMAAAKAKAKSAEGSMFIDVAKLTKKIEGDGLRMLSDLRSLQGAALIPASGKLGLLDRLLLAKQAEGSRVLLFSQWTLTLDVLEEYLQYRTYQYLRLDGSTNRIDREIGMRRFNAVNSPIYVYLISTHAGGMGINLATADTVILYDSCGNPQVDLQAQDRAHRIGQKKQVKVYRLITENTWEERVLAGAQRKLVLDALMIKKGGGSDLLLQGNTGVGSGDDSADEADEGKNLKELWTLLTTGAERIFDPTAAATPELTPASYDGIIRDTIPGVDIRRDDEEDDDGEVAADTATATSGDHLKGTVLEAGAPSFTDDTEGKRRSSRRGKSDEDGDDEGDNDDDDDNDNDDDNSDTFGKENSNSYLTGGQLATMPKAVEEPELGGRRQRKATVLFQPVEFRKEDDRPKQPPIRHYEWCLCCDDGGELIECAVCPNVYHADCLGLDEIPNGQWRCPWHRCVTCDRGVSQVGGKLFHCTSCPESFCFDCLPDEFLEMDNTVISERTRRKLHYANCRNMNSYIFYTCKECVVLNKEKEEEEAREAAKAREERELQMEEHARKMEAKRKAQKFFWNGGAAGPSTDSKWENENQLRPVVMPKSKAPPMAFDYAGKTNTKARPGQLLHILCTSCKGDNIFGRPDCKFCGEALSKSLQAPTFYPPISETTSAPAETAAVKGGGGKYYDDGKEEHVDSEYSDRSDDESSSDDSSNADSDEDIGGEESGEDSDGALLAWQVALNEKTSLKKQPVERKKPRNHKTAYAFFVEINRKLIKAKNRGMSVSDVTALVKSMWKSAAMEEKTIYVKKSDADFKRYSAELTTYQAAVAAEANLANFHQAYVALYEPQSFETGHATAHDYEARVHAFKGADR
jgi:hypothetical protein